MNSVVDQLAKSIMGKDSLHDCSREELQQLAAQYPFFGPAQVLLLTKLKEDDQLAKDNRERASIHFKDSLWLDQLLVNDMAMAASFFRNDSENTAHEDSPSPVEENISPSLAEHSANIAVAEPVSFPGEKPHEIETPVTEEGVVDQTISSPILPEETEEEAPAEDADNDPPLRMPVFQMETIDPSKAELSFEPYHTVDYFASQGVKVKDEEKPKDRFSVQLKSFTEWLKTMKRIPPAEMTTVTTATEEKKVEQMAERSISDREVVTEAMAEVWEKQGNHEKAREIYRKLSLLDPPKSSYFAAKIELLK
jgi:hypothetical protein